MSSKQFPDEEMKIIVARIFFAVLFACLCSVVAAAQAGVAASRSLRGSVGDKHIEMRLTISGNNVTGVYSYDQFRQNIKLTGSIGTNGQLELSETVPGSKKPTGKFLCKPHPETFEADIECDWSKLDGSGKALVVLYEQHLEPTSPEVLPKVINDRRSKVMVSYPQITNVSPNSGASDFNELVAGMVRTAIKEFSPESVGQGLFDTTYVVLFASPELLSIEMQEYSDSGGAHPNTRLWTINYNLKTKKQLTFDDVFKENADYKSAIAEYVARDINMRAEQMEQADAKRDNRPVEKREGKFMSVDQLPEIYAWAISPKGLAVYFDFPHVMAVFDKTIVPYEIVRPHLKSDGPLAAVAH